MSDQVQIDMVLPQPPERVWRALTEAKALAAWLLPNNFHPRIGYRFHFTRKRVRQEAEEGTIQCEVVELDAPYRLAYTWRENPEEAPDLVTWTLEPVEAGTRVRLEHTRLSDLRACVSAIGFEYQPAAMLLPARLARFLAGKRSRRHPRRGKVVLSNGSAFACVAISPSVAPLEEVR